MSKDSQTRVILFLSFGLVVLTVLTVQANEFGATWDEFLYYKGVRGVLNHGFEILKGGSPDEGQIFADLAIFGHLSRFGPYLLASMNGIQVENLESMTDAQKFVMGSFSTLNHMSSVLFGLLTALVLGIVAKHWAKQGLGMLVFVLLLFFPEWTGSSFFNNSDVPQGFVFTCFTLSWGVQSFLIVNSSRSHRKGIWSWSALAGLWAGISASTRPGSFVFVMAFYLTTGLISVVINRQRRWNRFSASLIVTVCTSLSVFYLTYPQGWNRLPWDSLYKAITYISNRQHRGMIDASWHLVNELYQSVPLLFVIGILAFTLLATSGISRHRDFLQVLRRKLLEEPFYWVCLAMVLQVAIPVLMVCISGTVLYGRLRHILLIYPAIVFLSSIGLFHIFKSSSSHVSKLVKALTLAALLLLVGETVLLSPYQYMYKSDISRVVDMALKKDKDMRSGYFGLYRDYYGTAQKRLFSLCISDKECLSGLTTNGEMIRQVKGSKPDGGAFNSELFEATRLLFMSRKELNAEKQREEQGVYFQMNTNKFPDVKTTGCKEIASLRRSILLPVSRVKVGSLSRCTPVASDQ